jgi:lysophospholipase L1-like esterase
MKRIWRIVLIISLVLNLTIVYVAYKAWEYRTNINEWLDKYNRVVDEFSQREVYREADRALRSDTTVSDRVVFFGTQVIEKWNLGRYFPYYQAINRGVAGQRVSGLLLRFRPDVIELKPKAVVIEVSSYNLRPMYSLSEMSDYVACMAELSQANGIQPVLATLIPPRQDIDLSEFGKYQITDSVTEYNDWLNAYAEGRGFVIADLTSALAGENGYLRPGLAANVVELNDSGYAIISRIVNDVLGGIMEPHIQEEGSQE